MQTQTYTLGIIAPHIIPYHVGARVLHHVYKLASGIVRGDLRTVDARLVENSCRMVQRLA